MNIENIIQILKSEIEYEKNTIKQNREHLSIRLDVLNDYLNGKNASGYVMDIEDTNGWFIGFIEHGENTYCFATNLQNSENATGSAASEITIEILNSLFS